MYGCCCGVVEVDCPQSGALSLKCDHVQETSYKCWLGEVVIYIFFQSPLLITLF